MVDLETLGTRADAVIMSIGAVKFDLDSAKIDDGAFYASVSIDSNLEVKRHVQEDTLMWWLKQSAAAQAVFHEPKQTLEATLCELSDWLYTDNHYMWSNGADFDLPMLAHAFSQFHMDIPWKFWNSRCVRTLKTLPQAKGISPERQGVAHNALADAIHQAKLVQQINARIVSNLNTTTA